jgi:hypothetical protein
MLPPERTFDEIEAADGHVVTLGVATKHSMRSVALSTTM